MNDNVWMPHSIALVTARYAPFVGGLEKHVGRLAREFVGLGLDVDVLTQHDVGASDTPAIESIDGATVRRFPIRIGKRAYPVAPGLWRYLLREAKRYDVVNAFSYHATPAIPAALARPKRFVFTPVYHGGGHSLGARLVHPAYRPLGRRIVRRAGCVVCGTEAESRLFRHRFPDAASRIVVVPPGIDVDTIRCAEPFPMAQRVVLCASRLEPYKNLDKVLRSVVHLPDDVVLRVIGDGSERARLGILAADLGLTGRVEFLGHVDDDSVHRWLRTARVLVSMSAQESFGMTLLEGAVGGAAVVASDIEPHREVAAQWGGGAITLVPLEAGPSSLAAAILAAAETPASNELVPAPTWTQHAELVLRSYRRLADDVGSDPL
jgi:glycosyltransferase involved in cell wall biosynthesis